MNGWIAAELFFVFIILWFIVDELLVTSKVFFAPQGFAIEQAYLVNFGYEKEQDGLSVGEAQLTLLDRLKNCPVVEAACAGYSAMPFDGQNSFTMYYVHTKDSINGKGINTKYVSVTAGYMDVFGFQSVDKRNNWEEQLSNKKQILSHHFFERVKEYGGSRENGLTYSLENPAENHVSIGGVTDPFRESRFRKNAFWAFLELRKEEIANENNPYLKFAIKVKPGTETGVDFESAFLQQMENQLSVGPFYLMGLTSFKEKRTSYELLTGEKAEAEKKLAISFFLLVNIFLGIVATFWYRTARRKSEIGLRMAMGASRSHVRRLVHDEGILLLTLVFLPAVVVCLNIQFFELNNQYYMDYTFGRFLAGIGCTYALIVSMILCGTFFPAQSASKLQPAEALHNE